MRAESVPHSDSIFAQIRRARPGLLTVNVPGLMPDHAALGLFPDEAAWRWAPAGEAAVVGLGVARRVQRPADLPPGRRAFGARAFSAAAERGGCWPAFGADYFFMPRWEIRPGQLSVWIDNNNAGLLDPCARILQGCALPPSPTVNWADDVDPAAWDALVADALRAIERGEFQKLVVSRRGRLRAASAIVAPSVAARLAAPGCTHYFLRADGGPSFFGATPERLVARRGPVITTEALAGTAPLSDEAALSASGKDQREHAFVVRALDEILRPLCSTLEMSPAPEMLRLAHLVHLRTRVRGYLREPLDVLALVDRLHPTPATAGTPRHAARAWLAEHEPVARGLYAGPVGWFDSDGNGDFGVALRCALVDGPDAYVYSGAGIVSGSVAAKERAETTLKRRSLCAAFGVEP